MDNNFIQLCTFVLHFISPISEDTIDNFPSKDETIIPYLEAFGEKVQTLKDETERTLHTLKSVTSFYIEANKKLYYVAIGSTKGVSSVASVLSTYMLASI